MNAVLGPICTDEAIFGPGATWVNEANFWMKHTPDTGSIARPGGLQPNALPIELRLLPLQTLDSAALI
jgi:hypothetical protein